MNRDDEDPRFGEIREARELPPKQGYYTVERSYYNQPPGNSPAIIVEKEKPRWSICLCVMITLFIILLLIVIIALIAFFASGALKVGSGRVPQPIYAQRLRAEGGLGNHLDLVQLQVVHANLKSGSRQCILETGSEELYKTEHISTARHFPLNQIYEATPNQGQRLSHPERFQDLVRRLGVDEGCQVIIYDHGSNSERATGAWWLFKAYGYPRVSVMQGGLKGWKDLNLETTQNLPPSSRGSFSAGFDPTTRIRYEDLLRIVEQNANSPTASRPYQLIDSRAYDFYAGTKSYKNSAFPGRISGAVNVPSNILTSDGVFNDFNLLREVLAEKGLRDDFDILTIIYGNNEIDGSALYFVLYQMGYNVRLYDGGWTEWSKLQGNQESSFVVTP